MAQSSSNIASDVTYTYYWSSAARDKTCAVTDSQNPTNPFVVNVQLSRYKAPYSQLYLSSIELPRLAQYTVENAWNTLYFSEGLQLVVDNETDTSIREFQVAIGSMTYTAILPAFLNPVISVAQSASTSPILTFAFEHGLEILPYCSQIDPIRLISTRVTGTAALAKNFTIIDSFSVQLHLSAPVSWSHSGTYFGYLYAPAIVSPTELACRVTAALNILAPNDFMVSYNTSTGLFSFQVLHPNLGSTSCMTNVVALCPPRGRIDCQTNPTLFNQDVVTIQIPSSKSLAYFMGFGQCSTVITVPNIPPYTSVGQFGFCPCESKVVLRPGNYDAVSLGSAISAQLNAFYFNGGCSNDPSMRSTFIFTDTCGVCHTITIPYGLYNPNTFAQYLAAQMNVAAPGHGYTVTYSTTLGFCFASTDASNFSLEFSEPGSQAVASRLGFTFNSFRGENQYCSNLAVNVPIKNCCTTGSTTFLGNAYEVSVNSSTQQYSINVTSIACQSSVAIVAGSEPGTATVTTTYANGAQVGTVLHVGSFEFQVVAVIDAFNFVIDLGTVPLGSVTSGSCVCPSEMPILNLFFAPAACQQNALKPALLGFYPEDLLYEPGNNVITSTTIYNLDQPPYLLLQIRFPDGILTRNSHTNEKQETLKFILAKIILYPNFKNERIFPFNGFIQQIGIMNKLELMLLNPDHTPYQFHGSQWSGTMNFLVPEASVKLPCY